MKVDHNLHHRWCSKVSSQHWKKIRVQRDLRSVRVTPDPGELQDAWSDCSFEPHLCLGVKYLNIVSAEEFQMWFSKIISRASEKKIHQKLIPTRRGAQSHNLGMKSPMLHWLSEPGKCCTVSWWKLIKLFTLNFFWKTSSWNVKNWIHFVMWSMTRSHV